MNDSESSKDQLLRELAVMRRRVGKFERFGQELDQAREALYESEARYRTLFEDLPISIWEQDFSAVKNYLISLQASRIYDFEAYFDQHPDELRKCAALVKIVDVNRAALDLFEAKTKQDLLVNLDQIFNDDSYSTFRDELLAFSRGETIFTLENVNKTLEGREIHVNLQMSLVPEYTDTWEKVYISLIDITARKEAEAALLLATRKNSPQQLRKKRQSLHESLRRLTQGIKQELPQEELLGLLAQAGQQLEDLDVGD